MTIFSTTLVHPLITEKGTVLAARGTYLFKVRTGATKPEVKKAVEAAYKVHVTRVAIVNTKAKQRRLRYSVGIKPGYKKAIVTLKAGETLDIVPH